MSLRILFADDSMTAQNMGKKILTDAGYEVVAVSNGAAAVKKIAEQKPDIIILDVYMPGYSGLEVCEKVRASIDTLKTPVLLTVGKMEPYKPEDASRVRADGVIIKPFEASDLLAIVKKLEERIVPKAPPLAEQTILLERPPDFSQFEPEFHVTPELPHPEELGSTAHHLVDVPDHMASSAAFGDLLGMDTHETHEEPAPAPPPPAVVVTVPIEVPPPVEVPPPAVVEPPPMLREIPVSNDFPPARTAMSSAPATAFEPAPPESLAEPAPPVPAATAPMVERMAPPVAVAEPEPVASVISAPPAPMQPEVITHEASPALRHIEVPPDPAFEAPVTAASLEVPIVLEPALQPTSEREVVDVHPTTDPALLTDIAALNSFPTKFGVDHPEDIPVGVAADVPELQAIEIAPPAPAAVEAPALVMEASAPEVVEAPAPAVMETHGPAAVEIPAPVTPRVAEDDFEARVARAMSAYEQPVETEIETYTEVPQSAPEPVPAGVASSSVQAAIERAPEPVAMIPPPAAAPSFVTSVPEPPPAAVMPSFASPMRLEPIRVAAAQVPETPVEQPPAPSVVPMPPAVTAPGSAAEMAKKVAAQLEAEMPAASAAVAESDNHVVAAVVQRVMERLKPELIEEIVRELKDKK